MRSVGTAGVLRRRTPRRAQGKRLDHLAAGARCQTRAGWPGGVPHHSCRVTLISGRFATGAQGTVDEPAVSVRAVSAVAYVDESGDESGRLDRGASRLFLVG